MLRVVLSGTPFSIATGTAVAGPVVVGNGVVGMRVGPAVGGCNVCAGASAIPPGKGVAKTPVDIRMIFASVWAVTGLNVDTTGAAVAETGNGRLVALVEDTAAKVLVDMA